MKINRFMALLVSAAASGSVITTSLAAPAQATEPNRVETVTPVQYGASEFSLEGSAVAKAKVTSKSGVKIVLNVSVKPIPKKKINRCWTVPVGTKVDMTGIWSGVLSVKKDYRVNAGDNTFCTKKGHGKQVYKKSCDNPAYGVPGGPKGPPPRKMPRIKGKVKFADFHKYTVSQDVEESLSGSAHAEVIQYDTEGRIVCKAGGGINGKGFALSMTTIRVRSRSTTEAEATGAGKLIIKAKADQDLHIRAKNKVGVDLDGKVNAYCAVTTPPPPPPCTEKCEPEPVTPAPRADGPTVNDVLVNNERDMTFTGKLAKGTTGKASASAGTGTIVSSSRVDLTTDADGYFTVTIRYRAGDEPGRDTVTLVVDQSDGQSVTTTTMGRDAAGNLVPHFEVRAAPIDPM